jgi:hypothetical protein
MDPHINNEIQLRLLGVIPVHKRHKWFRSMTSSQALAQSIFGNLIVYDRLDYLNEITDDSGKQIFGADIARLNNFIMEKKVNLFNEPRPTSIDCFISGDYQVAIECKLTEVEIGSCSRPRLRKSDPN